MSGHSKWHNIKLKKEKTDAQKGKMFTRVSKEIIIAAKEGGPDPEANYRLAAAVAKAKEVNMPRDNIQRAIDKGAGAAGGGDNFEEMSYEGYGPHGVAVIVEAATDNKNRTVPEIRNIFGKHGGTMGEAGCVGWMFDKKGVITINSDEIGEDELLEVALEAGAEDVKNEGESYRVLTDVPSFMKVKRAIEEKNIKTEDSGLEMIAKNDVKLTTKAQVEAIMKLLEALENQDDVQNVYSNFDAPEEILAQV